MALKLVQIPDCIFSNFLTDMTRFHLKENDPQVVPNHGQVI